MTIRTQVVGAILLAGTTYVALLRIAEAKNEAAVGRGVFPLDDGPRNELAAFERLRTGLANIGERAFADRLDRLRQDGEIWIAPFLGPDRWAVFVESLRLVHRIYIRRVALLAPRAHLYAVPRGDIPVADQETFAWISLAGALRHELAHRDGTIDEAGAYAQEIAWYQGLRASPWFAGLEDEERRGWDWALESAILSAQKASEKAASLPTPR